MRYNIPHDFLRFGYYKIGTRFHNAILIINFMQFDLVMIETFRLSISLYSSAQLTLATPENMRNTNTRRRYPPGTPKTCSRNKLPLLNNINLNKIRTR